MTATCLPPLLHLPRQHGDRPNLPSPPSFGLQSMKLTDCHLFLLGGPSRVRKRRRFDVTTATKKEKEEVNTNSKSHKTVAFLSFDPEALAEDGILAWALPVHRPWCASLRKPKKAGDTESLRGKASPPPLLSRLQASRVCKVQRRSRPPNQVDG